MMKYVLVALAAFVAVTVAVTVTECGELNTADCAHCTEAVTTGGQQCGWCISTVKSYCGLAATNCTYQGDENDEWVPFYGTGGNPQCTGGCESAENCQECSGKANCGYCHTGGCTDVSNAGSCDGAFTIGTCEVPCEYKDNCQNCLSATSAYDCQWCSEDDTDPKGGACKDLGDVCQVAAVSTITNTSICANFDVDSGSSALSFGIAIFSGILASFLFI